MPEGSLSARVRVFIESGRFERAMTTLIVANAITLGLETSPPVVARFGDWCSGQVKMDTQLSNIGYPLEVIGTDIPERRVQPHAIVEHLDVIDHIIARFLTRGIVTQSRALPL